MKLNKNSLETVYLEKPLKIGKGGLRIGPMRGKRQGKPVGDGVALRSAAHPMPAKSKGGRPRKGKSHLSVESKKPWVKAGVSRRTWYRRREAKRNGG